jgi:hypothetical protein
MLLVPLEPVLAADKALIVGVGEYQLENASLPGISVDIESMRGVAAAMGFAPENITVLQDREATLSRIRMAFQLELSRGVGPEDRVLFYFSGHGTQVPDISGDEADAVDEALMPYDTLQAERDGKMELSNVLLDDALETMLARIPAGEIIVIVDACHSGTVTRAVSAESLFAGDGYVSKAYFYRGMPEPLRPELYIRSMPSRPYNYVGISAARDDQLAIATAGGSVFTRALADRVAKAVKSGVKLSVADLARDVESAIQAEVPPERAFNPQLSGDTQAADSVQIVIPK